MALEDFDMVSDLNGGTDTAVTDTGGDVPAHGADAVNVAKAPTKATPVVDAAPAAKPASLRDQISSALKGEGDTPPVASQDGKARNPDGTFASKPVEGAIPAADPATQPAAAAPPAVPAGIKPEVFQSLPAETQAELARTMEGVNQSQQRFARLAPVEELIAPRFDAWAMNGMQPAQALGQLLALSDFATKDPAGFIKYMAQTSGVNLEDLVFQAEPVDPVLASLQKEIAELKGARVQETQQQQQAAHKQTMDSVVAFAEEKGPEGQPLRPYFSELGDDIMPAISAVKAKNPGWSHTQVLQEAYDRACWGSPSVRAKMQAAANAASEAQRLREGAERAGKARTASASVPSGTPTTTPAAPGAANRSLRDTIKASMDAASS